MPTNLQPVAPQKNDAVLYTLEGAVATITFNRPDRYNAANDDLVAGFKWALSEASNDDTVRAVILTGAGRGFCAGADMQTLGAKVNPEQVRDYIIINYAPIIEQMTTMPKPIIGAINGSAAGVGCAFALACDLRVMGENSSIRYAFINIGLGPDGGAGWLLTRQVGYSRAIEIAIEGDKIPASRCLELGLSNKVVSDATLMATAQAWATKLATRPTKAIGVTKADLHHATTHTLQEAIVYEAKQQQTLFGQPDMIEGVMAFVQGRTPNFKGK